MIFKFLPFCNTPIMNGSIFYCKDTNLRFFYILIMDEKVLVLCEK